jgi:hypothetical protein
VIKTTAAGILLAASALWWLYVFFIWLAGDTLPWWIAHPVAVLPFVLSALLADKLAK